jgi:hypothetical protein
MPDEIRVLIIEDEAPIRRAVRNALAADGLRVSEAETAQAGLDAAAAERPALIILTWGCRTARGPCRDCAAGAARPSSCLGAPLDSEKWRCSMRARTLRDRRSARASCRRGRFCAAPPQRWQRRGRAAGGICTWTWRARYRMSTRSILTPTNGTCCACSCATRAYAHARPVVRGGLAALRGRCAGVPARTRGQPAAETRAGPGAAAAAAHGAGSWLPFSDAGVAA